MVLIILILRYSNFCLFILLFVNLKHTLVKERSHPLFWFRSSTSVLVSSYKRSFIFSTLGFIKNFVSDQFVFLFGLLKNIQVHNKSYFKWDQSRHIQSFVCTLTNTIQIKSENKIQLIADEFNSLNSLFLYIVAGSPVLWLSIIRGSAHFFLKNIQLNLSRICWLKKIHPVQTIFTTRKLQSCLPSLKSSFDKDLKSHVVYELTCNGCKSIYVRQTCRDITTRVAEHAKADSPRGINAIECNGDKTAFQWKILDQCGNQAKLMTLEAFYIRTLKTAISTRDEYRTRELTLKA